MKKIINTLPDNNENFEKTINVLLNELKSDEEIYRSIKEQNMTVKEVKENIARLIEYKEDHDYCKNCPGIDKCQKQFPHFAKSIRFDKQINYLYVNNVACHKYMEKIILDSLYERFAAPNEWKGIRLNSLINLNLPNGIINAIVDYTLTKKNNILDKFFAEKIASGILREGITTTIDAMNYMKSLNKKRKTTIGTNTNKRQYKKKEINNIENNTKIDNNNENISDEELAELLSTLK